MPEPLKSGTDSKCTVLITHDVDALHRWDSDHLRHLLRTFPESWKEQGLKAPARIPWALLRRFWDAPPLAERIYQAFVLEKEYQVHATYFFFSPLRTHRRLRDGWYGEKTRFRSGQRLSAFWEELQASGFEIGLHLSTGAHENPAAIKAEWESLKQRVPKLACNRSHCMKFKPGLTDKALKEAGALADLSLLKPDPASALLRIPADLWDGYLEAGGHSPDAVDSLWFEWEQSLEEAYANQRLLTILLHPENAGANQLLERLLEWIKTREVWTPTVSEFLASNPRSL
ncbi:MAG: hypothetical protein JW937_03640 [Candidatus Omnitrophica bacterium]|nr:hypothetical protein [Candidatus Omnitrophota bacterium]